MDIAAIEAASQQRSWPCVIDCAVMLVLIVLGLGSLIPSWSGASRRAAGRQAQILRVQWAGEWIDDLEPQTNENGISDLTMLAYEGLTRFDEELHVVPGAAESWEFSEDGKTLLSTCGRTSPIATGRH